MTIPAPNDATWDSTLSPPPLPKHASALPNVVDQASEPSPVLEQAPAQPQGTVEDRAAIEKLLANHSLMVGFGKRSMEGRRVASFWQKTAYVLTPLLVTPLLVGAAGTIGFVGVGLVAGAVIPGVGASIGAATGALGATFIVPTAMSVVQLVGIFQSIGRLRTSRKDLAEILDARRYRKMDKKLARDSARHQKKAAAAAKQEPVVRSPKGLG